MSPGTPSTIDPGSLPLRDIHLPPPPAWWPPAPGWWLLGLVAIGVPLLCLAWLGWRRRTALRRAALQEFSGLRAHASDPVRLAAEASLLLRRVSLALDPARHHVTLTGDAWLARLRAIAPGLEDHALSAALLTAPYAPHPQIDAGTLLAALERWIRALPTSRRRLRELATDV